MIMSNTLSKNSRALHIGTALSAIVSEIIGAVRPIPNWLSCMPGYHMEIFAACRASTDTTVMASVGT